MGGLAAGTRVDQGAETLGCGGSLALVKGVETSGANLGNAGQMADLLVPGEGIEPSCIHSRRIALQDLLQRLPPLTVPAVRLIDWVNPRSVGCSDLRVGQCAVSRMSRISPMVGLFVPGVLRPGGLTRSLVPAGKPDGSCLVLLSEELCDWHVQPF